MTDALSLRMVAAALPDEPAIITETQTLTFAQCAAMVRDRAQATTQGFSATEVVVATPSIETIVACYAALEARRPIALVHPRTPAAELERQRAQIAAASVPHDAAVILFTSGSTGAARGVVLSREALIAAAVASAAHLGWREDDRWLLCLPLAHAGGLSIVVRCLAARRPIVFHDAEFDPRKVAALATHARATLASLVPTQLTALLEQDPDHRSAFRAVLIGGAAASPALVEAAIARGLPVLRSYGLTESFGQVATARTSDTMPVPLPGVVVAGGTRADPGVIRIAGPMLATRYLDGAAIAPELTTADLGYVDHDGVHVVGRADDVIISGGENVHPAQVEAVLAATPGVLAACAFGVPDARWGQVVAVALAIDDAFDPDIARTRWSAALPPHARPRHVALTDALPLLPSGKIDRRAATHLGPTTAIHYERTSG